ncbi:MAG: L-serine ammonia-lyase [Parvibaculaceae bacterium]|nr:L-serine ammonia-lyase [Parvibaculaceae bacterium]
MISVFELFKIGIGPSSSHTVGPMKATASFVRTLHEMECLDEVGRLEVTLYGSLAWTGKGHGTDKAVLLGLAGEYPDTVDPDRADQIVIDVRESHQLPFAGRLLDFDMDRDIVFDGISATPRHPNTIKFAAFDADGREIHAERWCSIGGGFVVLEADVGIEVEETGHVPYPFRNADELLALGRQHDMTIADMVLANELAQNSAEVVDVHVRRVIDTMMACIERGMRNEGELPGGLKVRRRARMLLSRLDADPQGQSRPPQGMMDRVSLFAIAVNEENAAGGRVVTAPTNGAAGVMPAVLRYYQDYCNGASPERLKTFLLTATAIGALFKMNASISGAEVGCQGEVGVACSMAAAGLTAALGGTNEQIENAAEIGMEHHLGMTCDPIGGLVQIPCIERNAFGAVKAINAASLAMMGDGTHRVSLDQVIETMRQTGADMQSKYKETSQGGLAVNFTEC